MVLVAKGWLARWALLDWLAFSRSSPCAAARRSLNAEMTA
jgi:hypothetical protein